MRLLYSFVRYPLRTVITLAVTAYVAMVVTTILFSVVRQALVALWALPTQLGTLHWRHLTRTDLAQLGHIAPTAGIALCICAALCALPLIWVMRWWRAHISQPTPAPRGDSWATVGAIRRKGFLAPSGWPIGTVRGALGRSCIVRLPDDRERAGVLVFGPPGMGKSSGVAIPAILSEADRPPEHRRSVVVGDPKSELTEVTLPTLTKSHITIVWDPTAPAECTAGTFDPLATLPPIDDDTFVHQCRALADEWFWSTREGKHSTDPFWVTMPRSVMQAVFLTFHTTWPDAGFVDLGDWIRSITAEQFTEAVKRSQYPYVRQYAAMLDHLALAERALGGIFADIQMRFGILDDPRLRKAMQPGQAIDWPAFVAKPTVLYLRLPLEESERLQPLISLFLACMYRQLITLSKAYDNNKLPREVRIVIDEFGALPRIYGMEVAVASLRSFGVGHLLFIQSMAQLQNHYDTAGRIILDCLVTKVCLGGAAQKDAQEFAGRLGERTVYRGYRSWSLTGLLRHSVNEGHVGEKQPLMTPAEIMHTSGIVVLSTSGLRPVRAELRPYFKDRRLMHRLTRDQAESRVTATVLSATSHLITRPPSAKPTVAPLPLSVPDSRPPLHVVSSHSDGRDAPPPGCSREEWATTPASLAAARWAFEDDVADVERGGATQDELRERWQRRWPDCSPYLYNRITPGDAVKAPHVWGYLANLAGRLGLTWEAESA